LSSGDRPQYFIAHDGHPNARLVALMARELGGVLAADDGQSAGR
jgi:hypothetical protein